MTEGAAMLLYDADCGFCTRSAAWLQAHGMTARAVAQHQVDLEALGIDPERARCELPFIHADGRVTWGSAAIADALSSSDRWWVADAGRLLATRVLRPPARVVYRWIARNRHRLPGATDSCRLQP